MENAIQKAIELNNEGMAKSKIEGYLLFTYDLSKAKVAEILKEAGVSGERADFRSGFYAWLIDEGVVSEEDVYAYIAEFGSDNTMKHKTHYWAIARDLSNLIHEGA